MMRSTHEETKMLEFFEWDEDRCSLAVDIFTTCVNSCDLQQLTNKDELEDLFTPKLLKEGLTQEEIKFLIEQLKAELSKGIYEDAQVINK